MPDTVVIGRLSHYGRVLSFRRDIGVATRVLNGVRTARMRLSSAIPSSLRIAGEAVFISYPGQPRTFRRCGEEGHMAQGCRKPRSYNCEGPGHVASECELDPLCGICLRSDHHVSECPFLIFSANVEPNLHSAPSTYADVTRQNRPASPAASPPADHQQRKRKAEGTQSSSPTPDVSRETVQSGKIRRREQDPPEDRRREAVAERRREPSEEREDRRRDRDDRQNVEDREERREDRRRERDRERESERGRRREGNRSRERVSRDCEGNHDRRRSPDRRHRHDRSPPLYSSNSESDGNHRSHRSRKSR